MLEKSRKGFEYQGLIAEPQPLGTPTKEPTLSELAGAYFRQENLVGSSISREEGLPDQYRFNPDYDPYDAFSEEEKEDEMFVMGAMYADNESELDAYRKQYVRELKDKDTISQGGGKGFLVGLPVMVGDPVTFLSVGGLAYKTIKSGQSILKGGLALGATAGADATIQETVLQQQQVARTYGESALNITGSMLLGGVLGVPLTKMSQKYGVTEDMFKQVDEQFEHNQKIKDGINPTVNERTPKVGEDSVGAQRVYGDVQISGSLAKKLVKFTSFDPLSRTLSSINPITRQLAVQLAESPIMVDNFVGQSVESLAKTYTGMLAKSAKNNARLFRQYKKRTDRKTRLSRLAFNEEVAKALRSGKSDIPEIKEAADYWNANLYTPIKDKLIDQRMLTEDVDVTTAVNYVNRIYDTNKIAANLPTFVSKVSKWLEGKDQILFEEAKDAASILEQSAKLPEGKPITAYHRTTASPFFDFKKSDKSKHSYAGSEGIYFSRQSDDPSIIAFGANEVEASVYINNPVPLQTVTSSFDKKKITFARVDIDELPSNLDDIRTIKDGNLELVDDLSKAELQKLIESKNLFRMIDPERLFPDDIAAIKKAGFDGIEVPKGKDKPAQIVALDASQVKVKKFKESGTVIDAPQPEVKKLNKAEIEKLEQIVSKAEFKASKEFEPQDYDELARQIAQRIMGTPDGRLPYDWKIGEGSQRQGNVKSVNYALRGPLKSRVFTIDDADIEEFLVNDIELLASRYIQQTSTDIELQRAFNSVDLTAEKKKIDDWYLEKMDDPKLTDKQRLDLDKKRQKDLADITGMLERMRGVYSLPSDSVWSRIGRSARDLNYLRFMGGVTISSLPDIMRVVMAEGFTKTMTRGLKPLIANTKAFNIAKEELQAYGIGVDAISGVTGKSEIIADIANYTQGGTAIERGLRSAADKFGKINILDYWTGGMKQLHAVTMQNRIFDDLEKGKYDKRLGRLGISKENADAMYQQVRKHGKKVDGVWITNAKNWDSPDLAQMYGAAMRKESDRVIVIPGQEKPLFMSNEMGQVIGQFRSFVFSATQRVLIAGLQKQDHNALGGAFSLISMGMFVYFIKQLERGQPISDDPKAWVMEGIDRSGAAGILGEINMMVEKVSGNTLGMRPLLDIDAPSSKFVAHSISQSILGPTFGSLLTDTFKALNSATSEGELTESDIRNIRRMLPYNNLTGFRKAVDALEERLGDL